ncbi:hypothetical protein F5Y03DRAFT_336056 [Xylaria venustula]|nr:hypothetical protein F5Y03DRAFT_336056 [Xylaria venustula]
MLLLIWIFPFALSLIQIFCEAAIWIVTIPLNRVAFTFERGLLRGGKSAIQLSIRTSCVHTCISISGYCFSSICL